MAACNGLGIVRSSACASAIHIGVLRSGLTSTVALSPVSFVVSAYSAATVPPHEWPSTMTRSRWSALRSAVTSVTKRGNRQSVVSVG